MFRTKQKRLEMMKMVQGYRPTSKASLKQFCLVATQCKVDEAEKLYDFLIKDMEDLPMFDPEPKTWVDNTKSAVGDILGFIKENQDTLAQGYELIRSIAAARGKNLPSIGGAVPPSTPLPPIN